MKNLGLQLGKNYILHCLVLLAICFSTSSSAQLLKVNFRVSGSKNEPVAYASVVVLKRSDTNYVQKKAADSAGLVSFSLQQNAQYIVRISSADYRPLEKGIAVSATHTSFSFSLEPASAALKGVTVTASRPLMRQEDDKTIVDPEPLAAASTNAYEILEKTPGIFVDQDGNIYLSSMTPSTIYINGRDMKMSTADIATMLKNLPSNAILRIEIIRSPSAKYDASGSGGIVNVVLKKGVKLGMTGSINAGWQQGTYGNKVIGINLNNNSGRKNSYLNLNYSRRNSFDEIRTDRVFAPDTMLSQDAYTIYSSNVYYAGVGSTWQVGKKWEITYDGTLDYNDNDNNSENENSIRKVSNSQLLANSLNYVNNKGSSLVIGNGLESKLKIDTLGSEWANDTWYSHSVNKNDQAFATNNFMLALPPTGGDGTGQNERDYANAKSDLKLKMAKRFTFEAGVQTSFVAYHNETNYFVEAGGVRTKDFSRTNTFRYRQNINAAYLQGSKTIGKDLILKFGSRLENTNMVGRQIVPGDTSFTIHRTDLFPYVYISKKVITIAGYDLRAFLISRRTIRRPYYDQLNPFPRYVDQYLSEVGNPALRPQFTTNYEANISVDERPLFAIGVNKTTDIFTNVVYQADSSRSVSYRTYDNLGKNKEFYLRGLGAIPPGKRYFFVLGAQYNHNLYDGSYENKPLLFKKGSWTFFTYHQFKIDKRSQITLNGFVRFNGQQQFYELSTFGSLNTSINRQFLKQKLVVTLSMNDIFYTNQNDFTINQGSIHASGNRRSDTQRLGINLRYNFGIRKKEDANDMFNVEPSEKGNQEK